MLKSVLWGLRRKKEIPLKDRIAAAIFMLESTTEKLKSLVEVVCKRDKQCFQKCVDAVIAKDLQRATMYANECAEIRKFARLMISSQLALEQACLRLNTIGTISDVLSNITPVVEIIHETGTKLKGIVPSIAGKLQEVDSVLKVNLANMGSASPDPKQASLEVKKILEEANKAAEEAVKSKFPEFPPELFEELENKVPIALTEEGYSEEAGDEILKDQIYDYLKRRNGEISIIECATQFKVSPQDVERVILLLKDEGKVSFG
jgi:division protein CdvB (Snf7/Vps24/ESCRT-III family)